MRILYHLCFMILIVIPYISNLYSQSQSEESTQIQFNGVLRTRGNFLDRNTLINRQTPTGEYSENEKSTPSDLVSDSIRESSGNKLVGNEAKSQPYREKANFFDSRLLMNFRFSTSKYFDAFWGIQVGDVPFGGRRPANLNPALYSETGNLLYDGSKIGPNSGGDINSPNGVNVQTNFLYFSFILPEQGVSARVGLQLFSSPMGRVMFASATGAMAIQQIRSPYFKGVLEGGYILARQVQSFDRSGNLLTSNLKDTSSIYYAKLKISNIQSVVIEPYWYFQNDKDRTDLFTQNLHWFGIFTESNLGNWKFILHAIWNGGRTERYSQIDPAKLSELPVVFQSSTSFQKRYSVQGGFGEAQIFYKLGSKQTFGATWIGTTGRPGFGRDGELANLERGGYRTLYPAFGVSNIGIDFTGGYAIFTGKSMSGLQQYGFLFNQLMSNSLLLSLGLYQLRATKAPYAEYNRDFRESANGARTSSYLGDEININIKWNQLSDFQIIFRLGYFIPRAGYYVLMDTNEGDRIADAILSTEYRF